MDRVLAARINQIARDDQSGAAELAIEALDALRSWLSSARNLSPSAILEVARALSHAHPEMAPLQRLSAEVAASSRVTNPASTLIKSLDRYRKIAATATQQISAHFLR